MKIQTLMATLLLCGNVMAQTTTVKPIVMKTPYDYQILAMSGNGKWACGAYVDYSNSTYAFLWNLENGEIEMLNPSGQSVAYSVSDNGIVVGTYSDESYKSNGAAVTLAGYWANHKWNRLELPSDEVAYAAAYSISPDGQYVSGTVEEGGIYTGYIWKNGKISKELINNTVSMPYAVSPDGKSAAGWMQGNKNRRACLWGADGFSWLSEKEGPWSSGRKFSPDGTKLLYWGYWVDGTDDINAIYDVATKGVTAIPALNTYSDFDFFDISNSGTVMGANGERGYIWKDGKAYWADLYLADNGVDLEAEHVVVMPETNYRCITRASAVSADDKVMGFQFYNDDTDETGALAAALQSMVVKFDQSTSGLSPVSVNASQLSGLNSVLVSWSDNVAAEGVAGYNVYRDGVKVNSALVTAKSYVDGNVALGEHKYTVTAVYGNAESAKSDEVAASVVKNGVASPEDLYTHQHGYNNAYMEWSAPTTNFGSLTYFDKDGANMDAFGYSSTNASYETAIRLDSVTTSAYKGQKITSVGFYPMSEQGGWKVNLYTYDANDKLQLLYSQPVTQTLKYGERNVVTLATPQNVPAGELVVAIEVAVTTASQSINALDYGRSKEGYSDLLRMTTEDNFYSFGQLYQSMGYLYPATWAIDATVAPEGADLNKDKVSSYNIYADGVKLASTTEASAIVKDLKAGPHKLGVNAVYADGTESAIQTAEVNIVPDENQLKGVDPVLVALQTPTAIHAEWTAPADNDLTKLQYSSEVASDKSIKSTKSNNYGIMAGVVYPSKMFRGRDGYQISSVRFYPLNDATFTVLIYKDGELINETEVDDYTLGQWNEVKLSEPITVDAMSSYRLVVDCYDVTPESAPLAVDANAPVEGYSNLYSMDGETWSSLYSDASISCNWLIGMNIESPKSTPLSIDGYDVNIDGVKKNTEKLTKPAFDFDFGKEDAAEHTISVDVYYTVKAEAVKGGITTFTIGATGIGNNVISRIEIRKGDNELAVSGSGVTSVDMIAANGALVASAKGNTVSLNGIAAGVYVVKIVANGKTVTRKIQIVK